ncbi:MAG: DUF2948 family protein [Rhizobiales bacterium]|nr:DUF2948 family protein [Hyphomicrobiales bacterium]
MSALKLIAMDGDDLTIIGAHCQDAVFHAPDITWLPAENRFLLSLNRFVWEEAGKKPGLFSRKTYERRKAVLHFNNVDAVQTQGIRKQDATTVYSLLSLSFQVGEDAVSGEIVLHLAGEGAIKLSVSCVEARLADFDAAWETRNRPIHP